MSISPARAQLDSLKDTADTACAHMVATSNSVGNATDSLSELTLKFTGDKDSPCPDINQDPIPDLEKLSLMSLAKAMSAVAAKLSDPKEKDNHDKWNGKLTILGVQNGLRNTQMNSETSEVNNLIKARTQTTQQIQSSLSTYAAAAKEVTDTISHAAGLSPL